jgi:enediyne biosynthesis protein E4
VVLFSVFSPMTLSRLVTRITLLILFGGLLLSGAVRLDRSRSTGATKARNVGPAYAFQDVTGQAGMRDATRTWGSTWADVDENGYPDLWIGRHWRQPRLFKASGGTSFRELSSDDFKLAQIDRHHCVWGEANGDGRTDLYCVRGADKGEGAGANQLFLQTADGTFENMATGSGVSNPFGRGRTANWIDFDSDGDLDIFVGNLTRPGFPNTTFRNDGEGLFVEVDIGLTHELSTVSSSWSDWDLDGDSDLLVLQHAGLPAVAYENRGGRYEIVTLHNVSGEHWNSAAWGDFDGDGRPDLHLVSPSRSRVVRNTKSGFEVVDRMELIRGRQSVWLDVENDGDLDSFVVQGAAGQRPEPEYLNRPDFLLLNSGGRFVKLEHDSMRGPRAGNGDAVAAADYDRDGRVDLFITNGLFYWKGPNVLLRNESRAGNWVGLDLDGERRNPLGFGSTVTARIAGRLLVRQVTDGANYRSQDEAGYVHIGLGDATTASITIRWPDGTRDCFIAVHGRVTEVKQGREGCIAAN